MDDPKLEFRNGIEMRGVIGQPHIFGRVFDLPNGIHIVPIGVLTLEPGGGVSGYCHPNEDAWIPYENGFAFVHKNDHSMPSSSWNHGIGSIPIGYFCADPESPQKLCLIPNNRPRAPEGETIYLIASCLGYFKSARSPLPRLLEQLRMEFISDGRIKIVVNGVRPGDERVEEIDGIDHAFSSHNAWEFSALYEAPIRWDFEYAMVIQDTSRIDPGFRARVESFNRHLPWCCLPASPMARCHIGLYSRDFLLRQHDWLKLTDNISKRDGVIVEAAGALLLRAQISLALGGPAEWADNRDEFDTGVPRVRRYFPTVGLHKFIHTSPHEPTAL